MANFNQVIDSFTSLYKDSKKELKAFFGPIDTTDKRIGVRQFIQDIGQGLDGVIADLEALLQNDDVASPQPCVDAYPSYCPLNLYRYPSMEAMLMVPPNTYLNLLYIIQIEKFEIITQIEPFTPIAQITKLQKPGRYYEFASVNTSKT
jgi:hypothetical protein